MDCTEEEIKNFLASTDFPKLKNERILQAARGITPDKIPIWIMRQAGRYLPEFQELRKEHSFFTICKSPKLACEATLMPIRRYDLDAAIIFSDILVIPQALGMTVVMEPAKGPVFPNPLTLETVRELQWEGAVSRLEYVGQAIRLTRHKLEGKVPLFGFSAAPWTLMVYMIEGGGTKTASKAKKWLYANEAVAKEFLEKLADVIIDYFVMQVEYGAQLLQIFESSAEYLNEDIYKKFMIPLLQKIRKGILDKLQDKNIPSVPIVFFAKGGGHFMDLQLDLGFEVIGVDWVTNPTEIRKKSKVTLQGNLDPCALYSNKENLSKYVQKMFDQFGFDRYIMNLGHGIYPDAPTEAVGWLVDLIHSYKCN